ncbi:nuclear transport factor 2 family protein [Streptomyces sp. NPDC051578]|uniref:nuclear transport factor 2 family protein n=1 Tax=Streptomyces sp. NPDC051578 TaxID=3365662 RepID=UPI0037BA9C3F
MPSIHDEIADLSAQVRVLRDRAELRDLFDRYVAALDTGDHAGPDGTAFDELFTEDAVFSFPVGTCTGVEGFAVLRREAGARWSRTHHISANHDIRLDGDRATLRVQQLTRHLHGPGGGRPGEGRPGEGPPAPFEVGGYCRARAVRTEAGWRLSHVSFHVVWDAGDRLPELTGVQW